MAILAFNLISYLDMALNILYVALGLGLVIFFHELGHFAVAKWCDVHVERFSIGFGPILWSRKRGETEYALSAVPFGGYVKMLGQDDMDPSQLSSEEIAQDPRSYSAKSVRVRMAIISAGVIMNVVTAVGFYAVAFGFGVDSPPAIVGSVTPGMPAWTAGLKPGDKITKIDGDEIESHVDIAMEVALSKGALEIEGVRRKGEPFQMTVEPNGEGTRRRLGIESSLSLALADPESDNISPVGEGTPAASADPPFEPGDTIVKLDGEQVSSYAHLQELLARKRGETVRFGVVPKSAAGAFVDKLKIVTVPPGQFRTLGLRMEIGRIVGVKNGSPAEKEGLKVGDKITKINGKAIGTEVDPLRLPDDLAAMHGKEVHISFIREGQEESERVLVPLDEPGWIEKPTQPGEPLSVPSIGVAFHLIPTILHIEAGSPAQGILQEGDRIKKMHFIPATDEPVADEIDKREPIEFGEKHQNLAHAFWMMQVRPQDKVLLEFSHGGQDNKAELVPVLAAGWHTPTRGILLQPEMEIIKADGFVDACYRGVSYTRKTLIQMYLTLRNLFTGRLSFKEMRGPVGIATFAYHHAKGGLPMLSLFLGFLSVNLAVLNFLPIPVLDGGHMVFLVWEAITRRKPSERVLIAATYVGMAFVLGLMITVLCLDIFVHKGN
ncbi:MAG: site-2 protease family protein [Planctomycetaceae bacterium]